EQVGWHDLAVLLIDVPPGSAALQQQLVGVGALAGAVIVVGPQDVAHLDARKFVDFLQAASVPILGGVENMAGLSCPHCGEHIDVFVPAAPQRAIWSDGGSLLRRLPLAPVLERQTPAFDRIAAGLAAKLEAA